MGHMQNFSLSRKNSTRLPYTRFVVFTEGRNTEPAYLAAYSASLAGLLVKIEVLGGEGDPKTLAKKALLFKSGASNDSRRRISSYEKNDQVWIMFDRDEHPKVKETIDNYRRAGISVAYSNPCFELWLILHFEDFDRSYDRHQVQSHFAKLCDSYSAKGDKKPDCRAFIEDVEVAERRASAMATRRLDEGAEYGPPFTDVQKLTEAMRSAGKRKK